MQVLWDRSDPCTLCPRACKVHRADGETGFCGVGLKPVVSSAGPHVGEESVLVGRGGSGTIFFAGCNLGCVFCQNYDISHEYRGRQLTVEQLVQAMLELEQAGCININFVTPTHFAASMASAIALARQQGLTVPIVYNSGGYDDVSVLRELEGLIDIYMPDMKFSDGEISAQLCQAADYPQVSQAAVQEMFRQVGDLVVSEGVAVRGLLVRHLVLPHELAGSEALIDFLARQVSPMTAVNVMAQYRPCYHAHEDPRLMRRPTAEEVLALRKLARERGLRVLD